MKNAAKRGMTLMTFAGMLFFSLGAMVAAKGNPAATMKMTGRMVYSCMKTESCPCDTEANMGGKCACGAKAPNMEAVTRESAWACANRKSSVAAQPK